MVLLKEFFDKADFEKKSAHKKSSKNYPIGKELKLTPYESQNTSLLVGLGHIKSTVDVLKFRPQVACQDGLDKQFRPRSDFFNKQADLDQSIRTEEAV